MRYDAIRKACFFLGLGTLFTHELDAMTNHEWRVLPLVRLLPEELGMNIFVLAHVPLFAAIIALVTAPNPKIQAMSRLIVAAFLVFHAGLHAYFTGHPDYEFASYISNTLIYGGALFGGLYLLLVYRSGKTSA